MRVDAPSDIEQVLYEGTLELVDTDGHRGAQDDVLPKTNEILQGESPHVTIGEPQVWNIAQVYSAEGKEFPAHTEVQFQDSDFFLVRLACSFRDGKNVRIDWARFSIKLMSQAEAAPYPIAYAMHPLELYEHDLRNVHLGITPSLNFKEIDEIEESLGDYVITLHYPQLLPIVTAAGVQESEFSWDIRETRSHPLRGPRLFHAIIKKPHTSQGVVIDFNVVADVLTPLKIVRFKLNKMERMQMSRLICK